MLHHLRDKVLTALKGIKNVYVAGCGPGGPQVELCPFHAIELDFFILIPNYSEMIMIIEKHPQVILTTPNWQIQGTAQIIEQSIIPEGLYAIPEFQWSESAQIIPKRMHFLYPHRETIDF
jgi:hypothetical protein